MPKKSKLKFKLKHKFKVKPKLKYKLKHKFKFKPKSKVKSKPKTEIKPLNPLLSFHSTMTPIVDLGCVSSNVNITDIVPINVNFPSNQTPLNLNAGTNGPSTNNIEGLPNRLDGVQNASPFQASVYLNGSVDIYNIAATANGYGSITLSNEGVIWTLWPLVGKKKDGTIGTTYFDDFTFGTATSSRYVLGQLGFFQNNRIIGCTIMTNAWLTPDETRDAIGPGQPGMKKDSPSVLQGVQGFDLSLLNITGQQLAFVVIKVTEQVARIINPAAGVGATNQFIYVGYDGWAILRTTTTPVGPMMSQTYISPQTVTGGITRENMQVVIPPNFPQTIYFKNFQYVVPLTANHFFDIG